MLYIQLGLADVAQSVPLAFEELEMLGERPEAATSLELEPPPAPWVRDVADVARDPDGRQPIVDCFKFDIGGQARIGDH